MKHIYYDFSKLDEFFGIAPSDPIEILSEEELEKQGIIKPIEGNWSGKNHPNYIHGMSKTPEYRRQYEQTEHRKEYQKQYYEDNKEKIKENDRRFRENNREARRESQKRYTQNNPDKVKETIKKYKENNRELLRQKARIKYYTKTYPCICLFTGMVY